MAITLMEHQAQGASLCGQHDRYGFWLAPGTGKTMTMLAAVAASKSARDACEYMDEPLESVGRVRAWGAAIKPMPYHKTVVVCPKSIIENAWGNDAKHFPAITFVNCWANTPAKRKAKIQTPDADVLAINFELFAKHRRDLYDAGVRRIIVDESSKLKSPDTQITKAMIEFCDFMKSVYLLSGTPAPNNDTEYWSQYRCIDKAVFGDSFYRFANEYFAPIKRTIKGKTVVIGYKQKEQKRSIFTKRMKARSWTLRKEDALDLPDQIDVTRTFELSREERKAYDDLQDTLKTEAAGGKLSVKAEALVNKLRQVCGGWAYDGDDVATFGKSKLNALGDLLDEIGPEPTVVWIDYREDAQRVKALCEERGERVAVLDGSTNGNAVKGIVDQFQAGELDRLVCHPASVGHGITLTRSNYMVFYTPIWSAELYVQARDRIHRKGQANKCTYYHLVGDDTIERSVLWACRNKKSKSDAMMKMLSK